jgi:betaine-aldehyde dehydrogenase
MKLNANLLVDGAWQPAAGNKYGQTINPANQETIGTFAAGGLADAQSAIAAARCAFDRPDWAHSPRLRQMVMLEWAGRLEPRSEELARLLTLENGKVIAQSRGEIAGSISEIR